MNAKRTLLFFCATVFLSSPVFLFAAGTGNLYPLFHDKSVKIYVADVTDATKEHESDAKLIKSKIEEALKNRKSIQFEIVQDPAAAELLVTANVTEFYWTDHDPVDMLMGAAATAYDIATVEDYARLQAAISVTDAKSKKELWKDEHLVATVTKKPMPKNESVPLVSAELAKVFIRDCFSKSRSK